MKVNGHDMEYVRTVDLDQSTMSTVEYLSEMQNGKGLHINLGVNPSPQYSTMIVCNSVLLSVTITLFIVFGFRYFKRAFKNIKGMML